MFLGLDTLSSHAGRAKLKPLKLFFTDSDYVDAFRALGTKQHLNDDVLEQLERFPIHMYGKQPTPDTSLNDLRYMLYCHKSGKFSLELLPPCLNVFQQHCKRANYQTYIWWQRFNPMMEIDELTDHGWCMDNGQLDIQLITCNPAPDEVHIIKQKIHIYTYVFLSLNHLIKFILVFYRLCWFSNSYFATANVPVVKIVFVSKMHLCVLMHVFAKLVTIQMHKRMKLRRLMKATKAMMIQIDKIILTG